jgi:hypothetical protein
MTARGRVVSCGAFFAPLPSTTRLSSAPLATVDSELLANGDYEAGFTYSDGCGQTPLGPRAQGAQGRVVVALDGLFGGEGCTTHMQEQVRR